MQQPLLALPISIFIILIAIGFGRKVLACLKVECASHVESNVFGLGIGLGLLSYCVLAIGLLKQLRLYAILGVILLLALLSLGEIRKIVIQIFDVLKRNSKAKLGVADALITLSCVTLGGLALINALAPPTSMDWDGLSYHLAVPKIFLAHHGVFYIPFTSHSNFPFLTEMLYTIGLAVGSVGVAKLFHFSMYLGTAVALFSLGKRHINPTVGKIAALLYMSAPVVFYEAGIAYADITMGFYILMMTYAFLNWTETKSSRWLMVCSVMGGFALGTKVFTAVPIATICALILIEYGRQKQLGRGFSVSLVVGLGALVIGSVWYIKSYLYTGNPVYPFLYGIFGGKNWSFEAAKTYQAEQSSFGMGKSLGELVLLPWNLLANGMKFTNPSNANVFALIGPAFAGLIPVYLLIGKLNKAILSIFVVAVVFVLAWFELMQHSRYLIAAVPLLCVIAGAGADVALRSSRPLKVTVVGILVLAVALSVYVGSIPAMINYRVAIGIESMDSFLSANEDAYNADMYINRNLPTDAKIVLFDETRGFYLDRDYIWGNPGHHEMIPWKSFRTGEEMVKWFRAHGYTHLLLNRVFAGAGKDDIHGRLFPDAIGRGFLRELESTRTCTIYEFHD